MARTSNFFCITILAVSYNWIVADPIPESTAKNNIKESIVPLNANWRSMIDAFNKTNSIKPNDLANLQILINKQKNSTSSNLQSSLQNLYNLAYGAENDYKTFENVAKTIEQSENSRSIFDNLLESVESKSNNFNGVYGDLFKSAGLLQSVLNKSLCIENLAASDLIMYLGNLLEVVASRNYVIQYTANLLKGNLENCHELTRIYYELSSAITDKLEEAYLSSSKDISSCA